MHSRTLSLKAVTKLHASVDLLVSFPCVDPTLLQLVHDYQDIATADLIRGDLQHRLIYLLASVSHHHLVCAMFASGICSIGCLLPLMCTRMHSLSLPTSIQLDPLLFNMCYHSIVLHWYALAFTPAQRGVCRRGIPIGNTSSTVIRRGVTTSQHVPALPSHTRSVGHGVR